MNVIVYKTIIILTLLLLSLASDLKTYKIKNSITYSFILAGLTANAAAEGINGIMFSLQGILLPAVCLLLLYMMRIIGAGDVKLFSAVGSVMGAGFTLQAAAYAFICGGLAAAILIALRHNARERFGHFIIYIKSCLLTGSLLEYSDFRDGHEGGRFHFSVAVAAGTAAAYMFRGCNMSVL